MNGHCSTCDVEKQCAYKYKPCDCCNYRKFKPLPEPTLELEGYYCVICSKWLSETDGVIVHDNVPHPPDMTFDEQENPQ